MDLRKYLANIDYFIYRNIVNTYNKNNKNNKIVILFIKVFC